MARSTTDIVKAAESALIQQSAEVALISARQLQAITAKISTGSADIDATFSLSLRYRLVFVRCHFAGTAGEAPFLVSVDSAGGTAYDADLFTITRAGTGRDVNLRIPAEGSVDPSPWTFQVGDTVRVRWTNPDSGNITWGLEVGLALAS